MNNRLSYGVLINGAGGKMGQALIRLIHQQPQLGLRVAATRNAAGPVTADFDIVLDFSTPQGAQEAFALAQSHRKPFLTGTTNLPETLVQQMQQDTTGPRGGAYVPRVRHPPTRNSPHTQKRCPQRYR